MNTAYDRLDKLVAKKRNKKRFLMFILPLLVLVPLVIFFFQTSDKAITEVKGVVINIHNENWSGPYDEHFYITIKLESGKTEKHEIPRESTVKIGDTVLVSPYTFRRISK